MKEEEKSKKQEVVEKKKKDIVSIREKIQKEKSLNNTLKNMKDIERN